MKRLIILFALSILSISVQSQTIERVEPGNWWTGMKYNTISLLVYGKDLKNLKPHVNYAGVKLLKAEQVDSPNYLFLTLEISESAKAGTLKIHFDKDGKTLLTRDFPLLARKQNSAQRTSFSQKDAICLIFPDRFSNGDKTNDSFSSMNQTGIDRKNEHKRHGGDLKGMINHLDYLKELGYTQIWNTPLTENDEPNYSYHGYAATDFYKIDPRFGTNELFRDFVAEAAKREIGVIWDMVLNHVGTQYYFIRDLPSKDWINYGDKRTRSNHEKSTILDIYSTEIDKQDYLNGWFDDHMADLNQKNPLVAKFLIQNTIWWIEYAGLSGLRVDTFSYSDKDFLSTWSRTILHEYPNMNIVGEEMTNDPAFVSYWQKGKVNPDGYECYLPAVMDFSLNNQIVQSLTQASGYFSSWRELYQGIARDYLFADPYNQLIFPDNHDLDRFYSRLNGNLDNWKLGIAMYMTMRGIPQFFYGTEVLMTNREPGNDGQRRGDLYGGWPEDTKDVKSGQGLSKDEKEAKAYFSKLLNWRKNNPSVGGKFKHYAPKSNDAYVYFRYTDTKKVMVVLNKNAKDINLELSHYEEMIKADFKGKDIISRRNIKANGSLIVPAKTAMIIEVE